MNRCRWMTDQGFRAAETHGKLENLKPVEKGKGFRLLSLDVERESRTRRARLALHQCSRRMTFWQQWGVMDARYLWVAAKEFRDNSRVRRRPLHAEGDRLERTGQHPA